MQDESSSGARGRAAPIRAAMVRFPTIEREHWDAVAAALAALGFNALDIPLIWREHEVGAGELVFDSGRLALGEMLAVARRAGLRAVVRLGPCSTDDAPGLGLPERVLRDRACQARTRRQNPVYVPDPPRVVPLPSLASRAYRRAAEAWVAAAARALVAVPDLREVLARVVIGDGPHALLRDDPFEIDHHPDARGELAAVEPPHDGPQAAALTEVARETEHALAYTDALVAAAQGAGLDAGLFAVAARGAAAISPIAHQLAEAHALALPAAPPMAGTLAIWRQVRHALALAGSRGVHFDVWSGGPPYYPPARGSHTVAAARVAVAAGARDFSVRMGCAGARWVGAVVSERGAARPHAHLWRALLAWAAALPSDGEEVGADLVVPKVFPSAARAATAVHPMPLGLAALVGIAPGQLASSGAPLGDGRTIHAVGEALERAERDLVAAGVPVRTVPAGREGAVAVRAGGDLAERAQEARATLADVSATIEPPGAALVRVVSNDAGTHMVVLSRASATARVRPAGHAWVLDGAATGAVLEPSALEPGEALVFRHAAGHVRRTEPSEAPSASAASAAVKPRRAKPRTGKKR